MAPARRCSTNREMARALVTASAVASGCRRIAGLSPQSLPEPSSMTPMMLLSGTVNCNALNSIIRKSNVNARRLFVAEGHHGIDAGSPEGGSGGGESGDASNRQEYQQIG